MLQHDHSHPPSSDRRRERRLAWALILIVVYLAAELIGGILASSLALLADAGHMLTDAGALGISLLAMRMARKPPSPQKTYGYHRMEVLAALLNAATLVAITAWIFWQAWLRLFQPPPVLGGLLTGIACGGLVVNVLVLLVMHGVRNEGLNLRGAWLHVLGDTAGSIGAILAGVLIWAFGWNWADPVASVAIGALILISAWRLLTATVNVLMEHVPAHIDVELLRRRVTELPNVVDVHDLHVWTITSGLDSLSAHVTVNDVALAPELLGRIRSLLHAEFGIAHATLQLEPVGFAEAPTRV